jgi:hypothetical protein
MQSQTTTKKFQPDYDLHLISQSRTKDYLFENELVELNSEGYLELPLVEYCTALRTRENGTKSYGGTIYYDVKELVEFMKDMYFEMVPGLPQTKTKHVNMLCSEKPTMLISSDDAKDINLI